MPLLANAGDSAMTTIKTAMSTAFQSVQDNALDMIATALPYGLTILGTVLAIVIGIKVFKKISGKA